jgi:hypothetical protein
MQRNKDNLLHDPELQAAVSIAGVKVILVR